jgi:hypothetical protein
LYIHTHLFPSPLTVQYSTLLTMLSCPVLISYITPPFRYYLRWLLDEAPLRARMVLLAGEYPTISCRSTFREHYLLLPPPLESTLLAQVRRVSGGGGGGKGGAKKGRRESIGGGGSATAAMVLLPSVLDMGFSSIFVQVQCGDRAVIE